MKGVCAVVLSLVVLSYGYPQGAESPAAAQPAQLSDLIEQAKAGISNLGQELSKRLEKDGETAFNSIKTQSTAFVSNLQEYLTKVSEDVSKLKRVIELIYLTCDNILLDHRRSKPKAQRSSRHGTESRPKSRTS